jgi:hypothetical protein
VRLAGDPRCGGGSAPARAPAWSSAYSGPATASSSSACSSGSRREGPPGHGGLPSARGRGGLVHAGAGPRPARSGSRRQP